METAEYRRTSRRQGGKGRKGETERATHFRAVRFGGYEETQIICCLWELVKSMESVGAGIGDLAELEKKTKSRVRIEMRRYFARQKRKNVILLLEGMALALGAVILFGFVIGIDRVSGNSMYPYLNHGDWIMYSRMERELQMDEVVVFTRNGENYVKRIAGLPGDTVEISASGSRVVVNGVQMRENYVTLTNSAGSVTDPVSGVGDGTGSEGNDPMSEPLTILDGQYLVLGDNRKVSIDSRDRDMGTVPREEILGRVILVARMKR